MVKMSLVASMLLTSGAYSAQIIGADVTDPDNPVPQWDAGFQFGFDGWNLENVTVNMVTGDDNDPIVGTFDPDTGSYPIMALGDSYESSVFATDDDKSDPATRLGYVVQKIWPISEPTGIKVINNDSAVNKYKPTNCIMASSYQGDSNTSDSDDRTYYLDNEVEGPKPVICSSYAGSSKRFQLILNENMMTEIDGEGYGKSIDLVFNIDTGTASGAHKYQVFQKVSNFTGMRLDGLKVQVLNANGDEVPSDLNISLGLGEGNPSEGGNIFPEYEMAFYPPGLWGDGSKEHLPIGWFDKKPSGYLVDGNGTSMIETTTALDGNYEVLFGNWIPDRWVTLGMHEEFDPTQEPALLAYWGTTPDQNFTTDAPAWHYGMYNNDEEFTNFSSPSAQELEAWAADLKTPDNPDGKYVVDDIEDLPNVSLNYIVNVGEGIDGNFTIRFTPKVSVDQTPPSYISKDDNETYILPPELLVKPKADAGPDKTVQANDSVTITGTGTDDDGTIASYEWKYGTEVVATTASFVFTPDTVGFATLTLTVTDNDGLKDSDSMNLTVTLDAGTDAGTDDTTDTTVSSSGGGGCTYNPNSKNFDMTFLLMMAMGLLYPFRRRFIK